MRLVSIDSLQVGEAKTTNLTGCALDLRSIKGAGPDRTLRLDTPGEDRRVAVRRE